MQVSLAEAEAQLAHLIRAALAGDEVIIAERGHPSVRLVPAYADTQIAAIAASKNLILVTRNTQDFEGLTGLSVENWFD